MHAKNSTTLGAAGVEYSSLLLEVIIKSCKIAGCDGNFSRYEWKWGVVQSDLSWILLGGWECSRRILSHDGHKKNNTNHNA